MNEKLTDALLTLLVHAQRNQRRLSRKADRELCWDAAKASDKWGTRVRYLSDLLHRRSEQNQPNPTKQKP